MRIRNLELGIRNLLHSVFDIKKYIAIFVFFKNNILYNGGIHRMA